MGTINEEFKLLPDEALPGGLHEKIMRKLTFLQFRTPFMIVVGLLILNLLFTSWHIWASLAENNVLELVKSILTQLQWDLEYFSYSFTFIREFLPISSFISLTVEVLAIAYVFYVSANLKKNTPQRQ